MPGEDRYGEDFWDRVTVCVADAYADLADQRETRNELVSEYAGYHYSSSGSRNRSPVNMLQLAVSTYARSLVTRNPVTDITTHAPSLRAVARNLSLAMDRVLDEMDAVTAFQDCVKAATLGHCVVKIGMAAGRGRYNSAMGDVDVGWPFFEVISQDDLFYDQDAKRFRDLTFVGNYYRVTRLEAEECGLFDEARLAELADMGEGAASLRPSYQNPDGSTAAKSLTGKNHNRRPLMDYYELYDVWLPKYRLFATFDNHGGRKPLRVMEWDGPDDGPYKFLVYDEVPDNIAPLPPAQLIYDLHSLTNIIFRKIWRQAERYKKVTAVRKGADNDGSTITQANDGEAVGIEDTKNIAEIQLGGADPQLLGLGIQMKDIASYVGGNLDSMAGLGPSAGTLGQDELIAASANKRLDDMRARTMRFVKLVLTDMAWYLWNSPDIEIPVVKRIPGAPGLEIPTAFRSNDQDQEDFFKLNFQVNPYSLETPNPEQRIAGLKDYLMTIAPFAPQLEAQGMGIDLAAFSRMFAEWRRIDGLEDLVVSLAGGGVPADREPVAARRPSSGKPPVTNRTYTRVNRPGNTQGAKDNLTAHLLFGGNPQPNEAAAAVRKTG